MTMNQMAGGGLTTLRFLALTHVCLFVLYQSRNFEWDYWTQMKNNIARLSVYHASANGPGVTLSLYT